jgi:hypothetical protein
VPLVTLVGASNTSCWWLKFVQNLCKTCHAYVFTNCCTAGAAGDAGWRQQHKLLFVTIRAKPVQNLPCLCVHQLLYRRCRW